MKRTFYIVAAMLLVTWLDATANAQNTQASSPDPCVENGGCVITNYDRFQNSTMVAMTPVLLTPIQENLLKSLTLSVAYISPGTVITRPATATFIFNSTILIQSERRREAFDSIKGVYLLVDGTSYPLGNVYLSRFDNTRFSTWTYGLEVPFRILELIASGRTVEMRAGDVEVTFDDNIKAAFRSLVELAPQAASQRVNTSPTEPSRTPKKRTTRRKRVRP